MNDKNDVIENVCISSAWLYDMITKPTHPVPTRPVSQSVSQQQHIALAAAYKHQAVTVGLCVSAQGETTETSAAPHRHYAEESLL